MEEKQIQKIKITATRIKTSLLKGNKDLIKLKKDRIKLNQIQKNKKKISGEETALEKRSIRSSLKNIGSKILSGPRSLIDKFKEFFGLILLGILVNNLPKIVKKLQEVFGKIKSFLDNNPWIMDAVKFGFKIIGDGIMALAKLIKDIKPFLGGTFEFALNSIRSTKNKIGDLIKTFDDLERTALGMFSVFGLDGDEEKQAKAELEGKYYSNTTKKTYSSYKDALKDPAVKAAARNAAKRQASQKAQKAKTIPTASGGSYNPSTGYTYNPNFRDTAKATGVLAPRRGVMGTMIPGQQDTWRRYGPGEDPDVFKQNVERYNALLNLKNMEKMSRGGTTPGVMSPQQSGTNYSTQSGTKASSALSRKAIESIGSFETFNKNVKDQAVALEGQESNYNLFSEFFESFKGLQKMMRGEDGSSPGLPSNYKTTEEAAFETAALWRNYGIHISEDASYESGYDISTPSPNNISLFDGVVIPGGIGHQFNPSTQRGYGNHVIIRSEDPNNPGTFFDALYAHFPDGEIKVKEGDRVTAGQVLGRKATKAEFDNPVTRKRVGSGTGPHTSVDFFPTGGPYVSTNPYPGWKNLKPHIKSTLVGSGGSPGALIFKGAKTTYYDPSLGGINASGYKTAEGLPATSTGEGYRANVFSAAAFPEFLAKLPAGMTVPAKGFPGGRTLARAFNVVVVNTKTGKRAVVRINDVGSGVAGHSSNHMLDFSVAAKNYLGTGEGYDIFIAEPGMSLGPQQIINNKTLTQSITQLMSNMGKDKVLIGQQNVSVELVDGKLVLKDTKGVFGSGLLGSGYDITGDKNTKLLKMVEKYLENQLNIINQQKNKRGPASKGYGGANASNDVTIIKETMIAMVPGPPQPVPFPVDRIVPIPVSSGSGENINFLLG